jgi:hypothetical protein
MIVGGDAGLFQVADFARRETTLFVWTETDLHGMVAISFDGLDLGDRTRTSLDDRNRDEVILRVIDLGHSDFFTE